MEFSYGEGLFIEGEKKINGTIILSEHKLFLKGSEGDLTSTYLPLEKIEKIKKIDRGIQVHVRPSLAYRYVAVIKGKNNNISELINDIVKRRQLKKQFLRNEWKEQQN